MKSSAEKSSTTTSTTATQAVHQPFFAKAGGGDFFAPVARSSTPAVQTKMAVNTPGDKFEQEADKMSEKVMRMPAPASLPKEEKLQRQTDDKLQKKEEDKIQKAARPEEKVQKKEVEKIQKAPAAEEKLQRKGSDGIPVVEASMQSAIQNKATGGQPLSSELRRYMEPRFGADFSRVRIHNDAESAALSDQLGARAFTYQSHIFFSRDQYQPGTGEGRQLLAHELTHTLQQGTGVRRSDRSEPQIQREERQSSWWDNLVEFGESVGWRMLEEFAPELVPFVRQGPLEWFKEKLSNAVESVFNTLMSPVRSLTGIASPLIDHFSNLVAWIRDAAARMARGDCGAVTEAAEKIQQVFEGLAAPVIDRIKHLADRVKNFFTSLWDRFGAPVWQFLQRIGGRVWDRIQQLGRWIWEKTAPIRRVLNRAWTWIKNKLGIGEGPEGQDGILQWIQRKAQSVWDEHIVPFYERYRRPLLIVAGVLIMLSPAGPYIAIGAAIGGLAAGIRWIRQNLRSRDGVVQQRDVLRNIIIPGILNSVNRFSGFLVEKAQFIAGKLTEVVSGLNQALGAVAGSVLRFAVGFLQWIIDRFQELVAWAVQGLMLLVNGVANALERLRIYLQPILNVLGEVARVIGNMMQLPILLAGRLWNAIPACIRNPFIDFFIPLILRQIAFFRELAASPEAWRETRAQVMGLIRQIFVTHDLVGAIQTAFRIVVRALRIPVDLMLQLLDKAAQAWDAVIGAPLRFIETALKAILQGMGRFMRNILSHLWFGVQGWLLNAVSQSGVAPPASWTDLRAVFGFVLDVMGISIDHVIDLIDRRVPGAGRPLRRAVRFLSGALEWLRIAIEEGPRGLWQHLVDRLSNLGTMVLESAVSWIMTRVVANVSARITALAASAGLSSVLEAVKAIYNAIQTAIEYMPRILGILIRAFDTVSQIAAGVTGPAAEMVESGLRMAMPVAIGFLANYAGLGGIGDRIREIILDVRTRVDNAILGLIDRAIALIQRVLDMIRRGVQTALDWLGYRQPFRLRNGERHHAFMAEEGGEIVLFVESRRKRFSTLVNEISIPSGDTEKLNAKRSAMGIARRLDDLVRARRRMERQGESGTRDESPEYRRLLSDFGSAIAILMYAQAGSAEPPVSTPPQFGGLRNGFGTHMVIHRLTKIGPQGTEVMAESTAMNTLYERREGGRSYYIAGHLLNHHLHGPGTTWSNLTPLTQAANGDHNRLVEEPIKAAVDTNKIVRYEVVANYGYALDNTALTHFTNSENTDPYKARKAAIARVEALIPSSLGCTATEIDNDNHEVSGGLRINQRINNRINREVTSYRVRGEA